MDSINKQQHEENHRDLSHDEAVKKIKELTGKNGTCFFCTKIKTGEQVMVRPMAVQQIDENGICWFLSANDSHKNAEIQADPKVQLLFQGSAYADFLSLYGSAEINTDKEKIAELWSPLYKTWFTEGENDPRITVIKFIPSDGYYWDTKHGKIVSFAKQVIGALMGKTLDDSVEGKIKI